MRDIFIRIVNKSLMILSVCMITFFGKDCFTIASDERKLIEISDKISFRILKKESPYEIIPAECIFTTLSKTNKTYIYCLQINEKLIFVKNAKRAITISLYID